MPARQAGLAAAPTLSPARRGGTIGASQSRNLRLTLDAADGPSRVDGIMLCWPVDVAASVAALLQRAEWPSVLRGTWAAAVQRGYQPQCNTQSLEVIRQPSLNWLPSQGVGPPSLCCRVDGGSCALQSRAGHHQAQFGAATASKHVTHYSMCHFISERLGRRSPLCRLSQECNGDTCGWHMSWQSKGKSRELPRGNAKGDAITS